MISFYLKNDTRVGLSRQLYKYSNGNLTWITAGGDRHRIQVTEKEAQVKISSGEWSKA